MEELLLAEKISELSIDELESVLEKLRSTDADAFNKLREVILDEII